MLSSKITHITIQKKLYNLYWLKKTKAGIYLIELLFMD